MIRRLVAVVLAAHGVAHVVGFLAAFQLGDFATREVETTLLWGRLDVSVAAIQVMGVGWLLLAIAFVGVAVALWRSMRHAIAALTVVTILSLGLTVLQSPMAVIGLALNIVILVGLAVFVMRPRDASREHRAGVSGPTMQIR